MPGCPKHYIPQSSNPTFMVASTDAMVEGSGLGRVVGLLLGIEPKSFPGCEMKISGFVVGTERLQGSGFRV